ncbi:MAG: DUF4373 domain-containing protein [Muribaculaceae bacterium]|nr:DUF4373 domain-containing protein [Muribaculaceae bacterium]
MATNTPNSNSYFSHDSNARNDDRILRLRMRHGAAGYGVYFMILERLREEKDYTSATDYDMIAFDLHENPELIRSVVEDFGLFELSDSADRFYSASFMRRMEIKDENMRRRSAAAQRANRSRWTATAEQSQSNRTAIGEQSDDNALRMHRFKSKVKKSKKDISPTDVVDIDAPTGADTDACASTTTPTAAAVPSSGCDEVKERDEDCALYDEAVPATAGRLPLEEGAEKIRADTQWRETLCMKLRIGLGELDGYIGQWTAHCRCMGQTWHNGTSHVKRHFYQWITKQIKTPEYETTSDIRTAAARHERDAAFARRIYGKLSGA